MEQFPSFSYAEQFQFFRTSFAPNKSSLVCIADLNKRLSGYNKANGECAGRRPNISGILTKPYGTLKGVLWVAQGGCIPGNDN